MIELTVECRCGKKLSSYVPDHQAKPTDEYPFLCSACQTITSVKCMVDGSWVICRVDTGDKGTRRGVFKIPDEPC
jgi:hypothetical protein